MGTVQKVLGSITKAPRYETLRALERVLKPLGDDVYADDKEDDYDIFVYTFEHEVPVRIFNEECKIDCKEIYDYIVFMYEK